MQPVNAEIRVNFIDYEIGALVKSLSVLFLICMLAAFPAMAKTLYVSDQLEIYMRAGKGNKYKIIRALPSGTPLEILETSNGYTRARAPSGTEGWVLSRFLNNTRITRERLAETEQRLAQLEVENGRLTVEIDKLRNQKGSVDSELGKLSSSNKKLSQQLEDIKHTASSALAIDAENKELKTRIVAYERQQQTLQQENEQLKSRTARDWFMVGAGVIILGIIIGLIIPRIRWRKKSSWDTL